MQGVLLIQNYFLAQKASFVLDKRCFGDVKLLNSELKCIDELEIELETELEIIWTVNEIEESRQE